MTPVAEMKPYKRIQHPVGGRVLTKQSDAAQTDVNAIMARWIAHGVPPSGPSHFAEYGDFTNADTYHAALTQLRQAEEAFAALPASVRKHVDNDLGIFLDLVYNPDRRAELEELGMLPAQAPVDAPPATPPLPPADPPAE